uniref:Putative transposase n=1 Tax=termite gut metagenome TaxID=433724 RepID=S0DFD6_9ZZZZ
MKYETIKSYSEERFRRIAGVKRVTFEKMLEILKPKLREKLSKGGRKPTLTLEEMLLAALEYWREYRTYAHIAASYGLHESNMYRLIKWVEDVLIKDGTFSLPGKKALSKSEVEYEVVLIDVTETPIERPKRGNDSTIPGRKSGTP